MNSGTIFSGTTRTLLSILLILFVAAGCSSTGSDSENSPQFDSGFLAPGESFSFTFQEEGTVDYFCRSHEPDMTGRIIVDANAAISGQDTVEMQNIQFNPSQITVKPNTTIVWINREASNVDDHTVTSGTPSGNGNGGY